MQKRDTKKVKFNLGCGVHFRKGYINVDKYLTLKDCKSRKGIYKNAIVEKGSKFVQADILDLPFKDNFADYIACHLTIEHIPYNRILLAFSEMERVLKPGGKLDLTTVDFNHLVRVWNHFIDKKLFNINHYAELVLPIYGSQKSEGEFHRCPFTPEFMKWCLDQTHFKKYTINIYPAGAQYPTIGGLKMKKGTVCKSDMIAVKAIK